MLRFFGCLILTSLVLYSSACRSTPQGGEAASLDVLATTTIIADVVRQVGGEAIHVSALLPVGTDPHAFSPTPQDIARVVQADLIFTNGAGLEEFLSSMIESAGSAEKVVDLSNGIKLISSAEDEGHQAGDPHVWTDPNNVLIWVQTITTALKNADPSNSSLYEQNAQHYREELTNLDAWIVAQVAQSPPEERVIVSDHRFFSYFARRYGFQQVEAIIPSFSSLAEPSARDLAALEDFIRQHQVRAILVGTSANPALAQRISQDTGIRLVTIYTGSLSAAGGEADNYLDYMRFNVRAIMSSLK